MDGFVEGQLVGAAGLPEVTAEMIGAIGRGSLVMALALLIVVAVATAANPNR